MEKKFTNVIFNILANRFNSQNKTHCKITKNNLNKQIKLKVMYNLQVINECLSEKQFTQLAVNNVNNTFVVSVYFRRIHKFLDKEYESYSEAKLTYSQLIREL